MGKIEDLADRFDAYLAIPASSVGLSAERVLMVVYDKLDERNMIERIGEFETRTQARGRSWRQVDCTKIFSQWMASLDYRESYFDEPEHLDAKLEGEFKQIVVERLRAVLRETDSRSVVAVTGLAGLYGFVRFSEVIREVDADIRGCLAVFFPGTKDKTNYRLLDARDGWNYLAHNISLHSEGVN